MGFSAIASIMWPCTRPPRLRPRNTSAPFSASDKSASGVVAWARACFRGPSPSRPAWMWPLLSKTAMFSNRTPSCMYRSRQAMAEAPAPLTTSLTSSAFLPASSSALRRAAPLMMAVPCWSSCMTGMSSSSLSRRSISKASGALMSSRLMPPNVGAMALTVWTKVSTSDASTSMSKQSRSAKTLNSTPLPSMTGLLASGPMSPRPNTAVPLEITATRLPLAVYR